MKKVMRVFLVFLMLFLCTVPVYAAGKPAKTKIKSVKKVSVSSAGITWKKAKRAKKYELYVSINGRSFKKLKTLKTTSYVHVKLKPGKTYAYKVRGVNGKKKGAFSAVKKIKMPKKSKKVLSVPENDLTIYHFGSLVVRFLADGYRLRCSVSDPSVLDYEWSGDWFNNNKDTYLYLIGKKNGSTYITISNNYNKEKYRIKVIVTENELGGYSAEVETRIFGNAIKQMGQTEPDDGYSIEATGEGNAIYKVIYYPLDNTYSLFSYLDDMKCEIHYDPTQYKKATVICGYDGNRTAATTMDPTAYKASLKGSLELTFKKTSFVNSISAAYEDPYPLKDVKSIINSATYYQNKAENILFNAQTALTVRACEKEILNKKMKGFTLRGIGWPKLPQLK